MKTRNTRTTDLAFARLTVSAVGLEFGHPELCLEMTGRGEKELIFARQVAIYLLQTVFELTPTRVATLFSRHRTTVNHAVTVIEESRDDPVFNRKLIKVEDFLLESAALFGDPA